MAKVWGVDSRVKVTGELLRCVRENFGSPKYWGRYLSEVEGVSEGLTKKEIQFIHSKGMKLLPIFNFFDNAAGYEKGKIIGRNAIYHARRLGIPKDKVIFANIERYYDVDEAFIRGWVESLFSTGYRPGFFHDSVEGGFARTYCEAVQNNKQVALQAILWSAEPETGVTTERKAPSYNPASPPCKANVWAWQYGRNAESCSIGTVLADSRLMQYLY
jgi:hypothetical protein